MRHVRQGSAIGKPDSRKSTTRDLSPGRRRGGDRRPGLRFGQREGGEVAILNRENTSVMSRFLMDSQIVPAAYGLGFLAERLGDRQIDGELAGVDVARELAA